MCQLIAANCICDPVTETIWPIHNRRKSRCRRDENAVWRSSAPVMAEELADLISGIQLVRIIYSLNGKKNKTARIFTWKKDAGRWFRLGWRETARGIGGLNRGAFALNDRTGRRGGLCLLLRSRRAPLTDSLSHQFEN